MRCTGACLAPGPAVVAYSPRRWMSRGTAIGPWRGRILPTADGRRGRRGRTARCLIGAAAALLVGAAPVSHGAVATESAPEVPPPAAAKRLADLVGPGRPLLGRSIVVGGPGSSVGAGATLRDMARDAPVAWFTRDLERRTGDLAAWSTFKESVPGTTIQDGIARDWAVLAKRRPDIVVLAYGMNDGAPAQFESRETFGGSMAQLIGAIRAGGGIPVILATPSAHTTRMNWAATPPSPVPQVSPVDTTSPVREVRIPGVSVAPESTRHATINAGMRDIVARLDVDLIDVEPYWLHAVAEKGKDALFDPGEFVHPNLLGHQLSYHAAIDMALPKPSSLSVLRPQSSPAG